MAKENVRAKQARAARRPPVGDGRMFGKQRKLRMQSGSSKRRRGRGQAR